MWKEVDGLVVVLLLSSGKFFEFNKVGSAIWKHLADGRNKDEITAALATSYDVPQRKLAAEVDAFTKQLTAQGLIADHSE